MKKLHLIILATAAMILMTSCDRLDILGMVIDRSDTEERVADWLDYDAQHEMPVIENVPDEYRIYSTSDTHYSDSDDFELQGSKDSLYKYVTVERNDPKAIFSLLVGDLVNQRGEAGYRRVDSSMRFNAETQAKNDPCFPVLGNHDVYYDCAKY